MHLQCTVLPQPVNVALGGGSVVCPSPADLFLDGRVVCVGVSGGVDNVVKAFMISLSVVDG